MIVSCKLKQVEEIKKFMVEHSHKYVKCVVLGDCITPNGTPDSYLELAIKAVNEEVANNDEELLDVFCAVSDITDGRFNIIITNSYNNIYSESDLKNGVTIYEQTA